MDKRIYGVIRSRQAELNVANAHARIISDGSTDHLEPCAALNERLFFFQRILRGNNKPEFINVSESKQIVCYGHMSDVRRIE
ncbi:hypothetical protein DSECCO2_521520 [anaerobic digester metagenome]